MFWSDDTEVEKKIISREIIDVSIHLSCKLLPSDHIFELSNALIKLMPWLKADPQISIQQLYLPASGNGWQRRAQSVDELVHLSKRTRLKIRLPSKYIKQIQLLVDKEIQVSDFVIKFGKIKELKLSASEILVSRFVHIPDCDDDEEKFLGIAFEQLKQKNIIVKKMLCGKTTQLNFNGKNILTRSLMLADLSTENSLIIQESGIGDFYLYGCGLFIPQKGIKAINND